MTKLVKFLGKRENLTMGENNMEKTYNRRKQYGLKKKLTIGENNMEKTYNRRK